MLERTSARNFVRALNIVGRAGYRLLNAKARGNSLDERSFATAKIANKL